MEELKRTLGEWAEHFGVEILDPDGFDRTDPLLWEKEFTLKEFSEGLMYSTIIARNDGWKRISSLVQEVYGDVPS